MRLKHDNLEIFIGRIVGADEDFPYLTITVTIETKSINNPPDGLVWSERLKLPSASFRLCLPASDALVSQTPQLALAQLNIFLTYLLKELEAVKGGTL